jgi:hypothetical protein
MTSVAAELDDAITQAVAGLRAAGYSWADIAARLGVTRQAARQRRATGSDLRSGGTRAGFGRLGFGS